MSIYSIIGYVGGVFGIVFGVVLFLTSKVSLKVKVGSIVFGILLILVAIAVDGYIPDVWSPAEPIHAQTTASESTGVISDEKTSTSTPTSAATSTPAPSPTLTRTLSPTATVDITAKYSNQPVITLPIESLVASTARGPNSRGITFEADQMIDGIETTSWQYTVSNGDVSAYVDIKLQETCLVSALWIKNGYWKISYGNDQYIRNSRPKKIVVSFLYEGSSFYTDEVRITLQDDTARYDWQKLALGDHYDVEKIRIQILEIYEGTYFPEDVAVSEISFKGCLPI